MTYANDMNYDGEYVWGSRFSMSARERQDAD